MKTSRIAALLCLLCVFVTTVYAETISTVFNIEVNDLSSASSSEKKIGSALTWRQITNTVSNETANNYDFSWYPKDSPDAPMFKSEALSKKNRVHTTRGPSPAATDARISWPKVNRIFAANYYRLGAAFGPSNEETLLESTLGEAGLTWVICRSERSTTGPPWSLTHTIENTYDSPGSITITWGAFKNVTLSPGQSDSKNFNHDYIGLFDDTAKLTFAGSSYEHAFYANVWLGVK